MKEDDASQHGQDVAGYQQHEESGVTNMKDVGSRISWREVPLVGRQHLGRSMVNTKHDDAPRWLA
jgi:hypothetical protein